VASTGETVFCRIRWLSAAADRKGMSALFTALPLVGRYYGQGLLLVQSRRVEPLQQVSNGVKIVADVGKKRLINLDTRSECQVFDLFLR
jgi:hypothetical protein